MRKSLQGTSTAHVIIGITQPDGSYMVRHWTGRNKATILAAARRKYPGAKLNASNVWYTKSYGARALV